MKEVTRCIIKNKEGNILLIKHKESESWTLPGGHVENKEDIYTTIKREIKEELGVNLKILGYKIGFEVKKVKEKPLPLCVYKVDYTNRKGKKTTKLEYIFLGKIKDEIIKTQIDEVDEFKWFSIDEIDKLENTFDQIKEIIKIV
ncbi:MAG: NUDIX hydrolase [Candidatus Gracilibacteria bacterium]